MTKQDSQILSLHELQTGIKNAVQISYPEYVWIHAELSEVNTAQNGHCYIELIEKQNEQVIAKTRATIWNFTFRMLKPYFESSTGYEFTSGIKVSLKVSVEYHELYGLSLNVKDIDPSYTVGDIELQKRRILNQLESDGIIDMNTEIELPIVIQNIAVISSSTAAGYGDWLDQMSNNPYSYKFNYQLFEAKMQGADTGKSIISVLDKIYSREEEFDTVIIIRGGGSRMDLSGFDDYDLAANIAQFPLPIITGIGHERDESIADIVAHTSVKTPTAAAEFLINRIREFELSIDNISSNIVANTQEILDTQAHKLEISTLKINQISKHSITSNKQLLFSLGKDLLRETRALNSQKNKELSFLKEQVLYQSKRIVNRKHENLDQIKTVLKTKSNIMLEKANRRIFQIEHLNKAYDPFHILKRGFAMIEQNNKIITKSKAINKSEGLKIIMQDGSLNLKTK